MLMFPSLITLLCKRADVEEYLGDNQISLKEPIYPLKMHGAGTTSNRKNRQIDLGKSVDDDLNYCRLSSVGQFEELSSHMYVVHEFVSKFLIRSGESSTGRHSYVYQGNFDKFLQDQKVQDATISRLMQAYTSFAQSHQDLSDSYNKIRRMIKRETSFSLIYGKG